MTYLLYSIGLAFILAVLGFIFYKIKKIGWILFALYTFFLIFIAFLIFKENNYTEFKTIPLGLFGLSFLTLSFRITKLGFMFFTASTIFTAMIAVFSLSYNDKKHATSISGLWIILLASNIGIFFANDWITMLISWELMGWTSFFIISHGKKESRKAGLYYFVLSLIGTATLIAGIIITYRFTNTLIISESIKRITGLWRINPAVPNVVTILFIITFLSKSAVFPFYMWPAKAHAEAPDDFSAFLSGVMIKYGVFGLIAFVLPIFKTDYSGIALNGVPLTLLILGIFGAVTAVLGTLYAISQDDMKKLMAYSTVGHIGYITTALAINTSFGIAAALFHTFNHMIFKGGIFLSMASVKYRTGEREMHKIGGIAYKMPVAFFTFLVCIIAAAGIPPMSGFGSKWLIFQSLFDKNIKFYLLAIPIFFASTGAFMYLFRGLHTIYLGQLQDRFDKVKPAPPLQSFSMIIVILLVAAVGFVPGIILIPVNQIITSLGYTPLELTMTGIKGISANINITVAGAVFVGTFTLVMIFFLLGKKRRVIKDKLDRYTSAEIPEQWDLTPEKYHFGLKFYDYFEDMVNPVLKKLSLDRLFSKIAYEINRFSKSAARWYKSPGFATIAVMTFITIILIIGWIIL